MSELKAGQVRIFQCESCGEIFDPSHQDAEAGWHLTGQRAKELGAVSY